jgi:O-antigen ligase
LNKFGSSKSAKVISIADQRRFMIIIYVLIFCLSIPNAPLLAHQIGPLTVFKWFGIICLLVAIIQMVRTGNCPPVSRIIPSGWYLLYFTIAATSSLIHDGMAALGQSHFMYTVSAFSLFAITVTMISDADRLRWTVLVSLSSVAWGSVYVIRQWQKYHSIYADFRSFGGLADDPNYYAVTVVLCLPLVLAWILGRRPTWEKWLCVVCIVIMLLGFMFAASRGGFLGLVAALLFLIWNSHNRIRNFAVVAILLLPLFVGPGQSAFSRLLNPGRGDQESSNYRLQLWKAAEGSFLAHPLFGVGMGHYSPTITKNGSTVAIPFHVAHNTYVGLIADLGLVGTIPFVCMLIGCLVNLRQIRHRASASGRISLHQVALGLQAGLVGYIVCAFFLSTIWLQNMWFAVFLSMCLNRISRSKIKKVVKISEDVPLVTSVA